MWSPFGVPFESLFFSISSLGKLFRVQIYKQFLLIFDPRSFLSPGGWTNVCGLPMGSHLRLFLFYIVLRKTFLVLNLLPLFSFLTRAIFYIDGWWMVVVDSGWWIVVVDGQAKSKKTPRILKINISKNTQYFFLVLLPSRRLFKTYSEKNSEKS